MYIPIMILWYCIAFLISTIENGKNLGEAMIYIEALVFVYWYSGKISLLVIIPRFGYHQSAL